MANAGTTAYVVVAGIDFSEPSTLALDEALRIAGEHPGATLHVVHATSAHGPMLRMELETEVVTVSADEGRVLLEDHVARRAALRKSSGLVTAEQWQCQVRTGSAASELVAAIAELDADLLVIGTHGRTGVRRLLLGSVADGIVGKAGCTVLVVRAKSYGETE